MHAKPARAPLNKLLRGARESGMFKEKPSACLWDHQFGDPQAKKFCDRGFLGFVSGPGSTQTIQHNTTQHNTTQHKMAQHNTI